ncbi:MAG: translation elongation factor Ts [Acidimicrobiales bacterium]
MNSTVNGASPAGDPGAARAPSAHEVQALRKSTGAGIMDAKRALLQSGGDMSQAAKWLREKGLAGASKLAERESAEGLVSMSITDAGAALVVLRCETDFVAKSLELVALGDDMARAVAERGTEASGKLAARLADLRSTLKENIQVGEIAHFSASAGTAVEGYLHMQNGRGVNGVLVELRGGDRALAHEIAVHVAFSKPSYLRREDVPEDLVRAERETLEAAARNEGKPQAALEKIVEGRLTGWFKDRCLLEQPYVRDEKKSVASMLGKAELIRFQQLLVGGRTS